MCGVPPALSLPTPCPCVVKPSSPALWGTASCQSRTCPSELGSKAIFCRSLPDSPRTTKAPLLRGNYRGTLLTSHSAGFNYHVCLSG